jgi:hypothetical protein
MLHGHLASTPCTQAELVLFRGALERQLPHAPFTFTVQAEHLLSLEILRTIYDDPALTPAQAFVRNRSGFNEMPTRGEAAREVRRRWGRLPPRDQAIAIYSDIGERIAAATGKPLPELVPAVRQTVYEVEGFGGYPIMTEMILPPFLDLAELHVATEAAVAGTRIIVAIELHRAERGTLPDTLDALIPAYLDALPPDPYTGEPFRYRLLVPGEGERGRAYILYSVGLDGEDNGGRVHERGAFEACRPAGAGFDFVINEP